MVMTLCVAVRHALLPRRRSGCTWETQLAGDGDVQPEGRRLGHDRDARGLGEVEHELQPRARAGEHRRIRRACRRRRDGRGRPRSRPRAERRRRARRWPTRSARGRPSASMAGMPVSSGRWCMATIVGVSRLLGQPRLQPRQALGAERAVVAAGICVVSTADEAQRTAARRVAVVLARGLGVGERQREARAQRRAIVVVAGEHVDRHRQRGEQLADALVLARAAVLGRGRR